MCSRELKDLIDAKYDFYVNTSMMCKIRVNSQGDCDAAAAVVAGGAWRGWRAEGVVSAAHAARARRAR